jgi:phage terminase large subunit-like protein
MLQSKTRGSASLTPRLRDSHGGAFVAWCARFVVHGEGDLWGKPFLLRPDQVLWAYQWFEVDATGNWWHERCYYEAPKGSGKTMLLAAAALFELFGPLAPPHPNIPVAAAGQDQAMKDGIYGRICQILEHENCPLRPFARVGWDVIERLDRPGQIRCIPANGNTTDGGLPTLFLADEVQDWFHTAADAHERNENSTTKREAPVGRSISASTPGEYAGDGSVGWRLHNYGEQIVKGTVPDDRFLFVQHKADESWDLDDPEQLERALRQANYGASDRKIERLTRRFREIPRHRFCRFHLGQWVVSDGVRWMDMEAWQRQTVADVPPAGAEIVAFFDGSVNDDATGIVGQTAAGHLFVVGCWEKPEFGPEWKVPKDEVNLAVADMMATYKVQHFGYDPSAGWRSDGQEWERLYGDGVVHETPPTDARAAPACDQLFSDIVNGTVTHDGDLRLFDHVRNAVGKRTAKGTTIRKESQDSPRKIDLAFCAVMANDLRVRFMSQPKKKRTFVTF